MQWEREQHAKDQKRPLEAPQLLIVVEIALGSTISLLLASWAGLAYSASAGVTALLTIQNTRDKTLWTTLQRYRVFLLIPHQRQPLSHYRDQVEMALKDILATMSRRALGLCQVDSSLITCTTDALNRENEQMQDGFARLEQMLGSYELAARDEGGNRLQGRSIYPIKYFQMRTRQIGFLKRIWSNLERVQRVYSASQPLSALLKDIADSFAESNNALRLLEEQAKLEQSYEASPLPQSRGEFEVRALLFVMLQDIRSFLEIKRDFYASLASEEIRKYWQAGNLKTSLGLTAKDVWGKVGAVFLTVEGMTWASSHRATWMSSAGNRRASPILTAAS